MVKSQFMSRRRLMACAAGGLLTPAGLLVPGVSFGRDEQAAYRYITPFGYNLGFAEALYAKTGGFFQKNDLALDIEAGRNAPGTLQQLSAGHALVARSAGTDLMRAHAKDPQVIAIAEIVRKDNFYLVSHRDRPINDPEGMVGKTIGVISVGSAPEIAVRTMLAARGITGKVTTQPVGNAPSVFQLIEAGRLQGSVLTSDTVFALSAMKTPMHTFSTDEFARLPGQFFISTRAQLDQYKPEVAKFLRGVHQAIAAMIDLDKQGKLLSVVDSISSQFDIAEVRWPDKGVAALRNKLLKSYAEPIAANFATDPQVWTNAAALMIKANLLAPDADRNFFDGSALKLAFA